MNFVSVQYLVFILVVFFVYWHMSRRYQNFFLLIASYIFYARWNWRFLSVIIVLTTVDYICGPRIYYAASATRKKSWLTVSLVVNLGILGYFKYYNFFIESFATLAQSVGWHTSLVTLDILLPIGISFYTFRSMSYSIDIYRGNLNPTNSFINYAVFVSFFPHLAAGPITRAHEFIFQLENKKPFSGEDLQIGLTRFLLGFFKKAFIADTLAFYIVDPIFAAPGNYSSGMLWLGMLGYTVQIYADFSGYSSMAIGSARVLGLRLPENFNFPYLSRNVSEFWRRWHMTMSSFFRDYIYISLGGNRKGMVRTLRNLAATILISGLWHEAGLTFILWGVLHGIYIVAYHLWRSLRDRRADLTLGSGFPIILLAWLVTQLLVSLAWILFRSPDSGAAWSYIRGLVQSAGTGGIEAPLVVWMAFFSFIIDHFAGWLVQYRPEVKQKIPVYVQALIYATMIVLLFHTRIESANPFIYFKF